MYKVIIIEDDPMVTYINKQYVELNKYLKVVARFTNGKDALEFLQKNKVDLAILDVYMPVMDGTEFLTEIRKTNHDIDVIMVTAANDATHIKQFLSLGILDYLIKPFEYVRFNHALAKFIQHRELLENDNFSQSQIDALISDSSLSNGQQDFLNKGLQEKTLSTILEYMKNHKNENLTSEKIAEDVHLSRVTVRRYMNYLLEKQEIISSIDYTTGGRPSIIYQYVKL